MSGDPFLDALNAKVGATPPGALNNPGNLLPGVGRIVFPGQTGTDQRGIASFVSPEAGRNAQIWQLQEYQRKAGHPLSFLDIANIYAPKGHGANDPAAYATRTAQAFGKAPTDAVDLSDPTTAARLADAHTAVEQGQPIAVPPPTDSGPDPFLAAMDNAIAGHVDNGPADTGGAGGGSPTPDNDGVGVPGGAQEGWASRAGGFLADANDQSFSGMRNRGTGLIAGAAAVPESLLHAGAWAIDKTGYGHKTAETLRRWSGNIDSFTHSLAEDPNSPAFKVGEVGGEIGATLPLAEVKALQAAPWLAKLPTAARYGDMALEGATAGAALSKGENVGTNMALGAALGPAGGKLVDVAGPALLRATERVAGSKLAQSLKNFASKGGEEAAGIPETGGPTFGPAAAEAAHFSPAIKAPAGVPQFEEDGSPFVGMLSGDETSGGKPIPQYGTPDQPGARGVKADPKAISAALGSRGARSGIEANPDLPQPVAEHVARLKDQGVPLEQAIREAEITHVGAKPTVAAVTRSPEEQAAMWEGAKQATPEGRELAQQIAQNNAAVLGRVQSMVEANGGVPAQGEAAQTAAQSLAKASDAAYAKVNGAYAAARTAEGDATISIDPLRELLATPRYKAPTTAEQRDLIKGIRDLANQMSKQNGNRFSAEEVESLRQAANAAYDKMGGRANSTVGEIKAALDQSLDQLEKAGPAYKKARELHKQWAAAYENPEGISSLIRRDAKGNFLNEDNWRKAEGFVASTADRPFVQVVKQLRANGDEAAIGRLKASVLQRAYQSAANNATDKLGNATLDGKKYFAELDKIGTTKLKALFSPQELAEIATTGRAAIHMNEAVPGANNTSNTASALARALGTTAQPSSKAKAAARLVGHAVGLATGHLGGNVAVEGVHHVAAATSKRASSKALAEALRESMTPDVSRAAEAARAQRLADTLRRRSASRTLSDRTAPVAAAATERRQ